MRNNNAYQPTAYSADVITYCGLRSRGSIGPIAHAFWVMTYCIHVTL